MKLFGLSSSKQNFYIVFFLGQGFRAVLFRLFWYVDTDVTQRPIGVADTLLGI